MKIIQVDPARADEIARLAVCLTEEIMERTGSRHFGIDVPKAEALCRELLTSGRYVAFAALDGDEVVGFGTLCESHALYAEGSFGIVQEFYVKPVYRSHRIGRELLEKIVLHARTQGWKRLELCTPPVPEFDRTVAFYRENGFEITGGYKMKRLLD